MGEIVQLAEVVVLPSGDWSQWMQQVQSAQTLKDLVPLILDAERAVFAHAEPYTVAQRDASKDAENIDLETIGIAGPEGPGRRGKKLLWHTAAEEACWRQGAEEATVVARLGFVVAVFLRRARVLLEKIGAKKVGEKKRKNMERTHTEDATAESAPKTQKGAPPQPAEPLEFEFSTGIVWGKVAGYPWWPAEACEMPLGGMRGRCGAKMYRFLNSDEFSFLLPSQIVKFHPSTTNRMLPLAADRHYPKVVEALRLATERGVATMGPEHRTGQIVCVELEGFPWWPAEVAVVPDVVRDYPGQTLVMLFRTQEVVWVNEWDLRAFRPSDCQTVLDGDTRAILQQALELATQAHDERERDGRLVEFCSVENPKQPETQLALDRPTLDVLDTNLAEEL